MKKKDKLYRYTLVRVGVEKMRGIDRLIEQGHHGIAERHTVEKLIAYVEGLEKQQGINVPNPDKDAHAKSFIRINQNGASYFVNK